MLNRLVIQNYAIISRIEIAFGPGLNIITGETGAGKSILAGALGLALGDRADSTVLRDKQGKAMVEAWFNARGNADVELLLAEWEIDFDGELILRREVMSSGKSRSFINDTPVNLSELQRLSARIIDMHQQYDSLHDGNADLQYQVIDALAGNEAGLKTYKSLYTRFTELSQKLTRIREDVSRSQRELDYHRFLLDELQILNLRENELEDLDEELKVLSHAEQIKSTVGSVVFDLMESDQPLVQQLKSMTAKLQSIAPYHISMDPLAERLKSVQIELRDIAGELSHVNDKLILDPQRIDEVSARLAAGQKLLKKHGATDTATLLKIQADLEDKIRMANMAGEAEEVLEKQKEEAYSEAMKVAGEISARRRKQADMLEKRIAALLVRVGMPAARLAVDIRDAVLNPYGKDQVSFLFDANKSNRFEPLHKVASGGELSRLMLSLKSLLASTVNMPTLIFDEIDSGISGEAARQVGLLMKELGRSHQVISITHQPQIAARADQHYYVFKKETAGQIQTHVRQLAQQERIEAIARMLGGEQPTRVAIENAKEMVNAE